eukprot:5153208-Lingulodinium_polyedra.AAC.1
MEQYQCPVCEVNSQAWEPLQWHIRTHAEGPKVLTFAGVAAPHAGLGAPEAQRWRAAREPQE